MQECEIAKECVPFPVRHPSPHSHSPGLNPTEWRCPQWMGLTISMDTIQDNPPQDNLI